MKPVLANLGFVLQMSGLFIILPILTAFYYNETNPLISFFITSLTFLGIGFLMNALCERKELDFKSSCILITIVFFLLGLIGSIPYFYLNVFQDTDATQRLVNNYFESISGYTTAGLTLTTNIDSLPKSVIFYRSLTQWIGGIGIVFILLAFFYPSNAINNLSRVIGIEKMTHSLKKTYISVLFIYVLYALLFVTIFYLLGLKDLITNISLVFSTIATGGFSPVSDFPSLIPFPNNFILNILMILGAISFIVHHRLLTGRFREALTKEFLVFLLLIAIFTALIFRFVTTDLYSAIFHAISGSTTTGYSFMNFKQLDDTGKLIFISLMFIGGSTFSTAGGIKVLRLILFFKTIAWMMKNMISGTTHKLVFEGRELSSIDVVHHLLVVLMAVLMLFVSAFIFSLYGFSFTDSAFELTSAFATTGYSLGITNLSLPIILKLVLTLVMVFGRIEIIPFLFLLSREKTAS